MDPTALSRCSHQLTNANLELEPLRRRTKRIGNLGPMKDLARGLFQALQRGLQCTCLHTVNLNLTRLNDIHHGDQEDLDASAIIHFRVLLSNESPPIPVWTDLDVGLLNPTMTLPCQLTPLRMILLS